jgi:outer membrane protein TolC
VVRNVLDRLVFLSLTFVLAQGAWGQQPEPQARNLALQADGPQQAPAQAAPSTQAPLTLTFQDALARARKYNIEFNAALTDQGVARQDRVQARAALLPSVGYQNQYLYTQGNGQNANIPVFVANNAVHEYISQGNVHEAIGFAEVAGYKRAQALEAVAKARAEIAKRGLVVTVVQAYYGFIAAQRKYATMQQAAGDAKAFFELSGKLEKGGEVAHSDLIKAQIQYKDRQRDLRESELAMTKSRLDLAVLLFPDFNENFSVVDDLDLAPPLQTFAEFESAAETRNPELRAAQFSLRAAESDLTGARAGYLPSLAVDYWYGIDATHFATQETVITPAGVPFAVNTLGSSAEATLNVPLWNWGSTHSKVVQADLRRKQAQRELSMAQRKLLAEIRIAYDEAQAALSELELLKSSSELAAESLRLTTLRYQGGAATVLEVVDAQNTLAQERSAYADGLMRYRTALAGLQVLSGTI